MYYAQKWGRILRSEEENLSVLTTELLHLRELYTERGACCCSKLDDKSYATELQKYKCKHLNTASGSIGKTISCRSWDVIIPLYPTLVRPYLDYCIQAWSSQLKKLNTILHCSTKTNTEHRLLHRKFWHGCKKNWKQTELIESKHWNRLPREMVALLLL